MGPNRVVVFLRITLLAPFAAEGDLHDRRDSATVVRLSRIFAFVCAAFVLIAPARVQADETIEAPEVARLGAVLDHLRAESSDYRVLGATAALVCGAVVMPAGAYMLGKGDHFGGDASLGLGIAAAFEGVSILTLPLDPSDDVREVFESGRAARMPAHELVAQAEARWREKVETLRIRRRTVGILSMGLGVLALGAGTAVLVSPTPQGLTRDHQDGLAVAGLGVGVVATAIGARFFAFEEPLETAWATYEATKGGAPAGGSPGISGVFAPHVRVRPLAGGAEVALGMEF